MNKSIVDEQRFELMRLFLSEKDNRIDVLSERIGMSRISASNIIDKYYKNGGLIIESKMNNREIDELEYVEEHLQTA